MSEKDRTDFCVGCRRDTQYVLQKKNIVKTMKAKEYMFSITCAVCSECGEEMNLPGLIDKNIQEVEEQYRYMEGLISVRDIERLMKIYKLGKAPLSLALGFGEVTVARYISGQIPSKEYSNVMKTALSSPAYMKELLAKNRKKIADAAYNKAMAAASQLENLFSVSERMLRIIAYVFESLEEVTPLMLQKLLYFIQGVSYAVCGSPVFTEDCEAWIHGPVYPEVYALFRDFRYNPIEDARFAIFENAKDELTSDERKIVDLVVGTFGLYGGKALERITHNEEPWKKARIGYDDNILSNVPITKKSIEDYYVSVNRRYRIETEAGLKKYIQDMLDCYSK